MVEVLPYPTLESSDYEQNLVLTGSSTIVTLRVYKHHTGGKFAYKDADEWSDFAMLASFSSAESTCYSKLYVGRCCLDFQLDKVRAFDLQENMLPGLFIVPGENFR